MICTSTRRGFTLLELLVVIAIIGVLSTVVLASLNSARARARFSQVSAELDQIYKASIEHYYDNNGVFAPDEGSGITPDFVPSYLPKWPTPPCPGYKYDWENWNGGANIRVSLRRADTSIVYQKCIYQDGIACNDIRSVSPKSLQCN